MSALSSHLENAIANLILGSAAYSVPGTLHFALFTTTPNEAGTGGTEVSTSGTAYARVAVTNNTTNFPTTSNGTKSNGTAFTFPTATASWGTVVGWGIYDASSSGNLLFFGNLTTSRSIASGDTARFATGDISITFD
ncbi:MAG: hypothetical protein IAE97_00160 [Chthoniobacterales bacterium]|nr:hypothetical protein [Chthoniobacterales bacterium]